MQVQYEKKGNKCKIYLSGELDESTSNYFRTSLDEILSDISEFSVVEYDLSKLSFMDSTGIGVLIGRYKKFDTKKIGFEISNPNSTIDRILKMTGIYQLMPRVL